MAYRFKIHETPQHGLRRLGTEQIERAQRALTAAELSGGAIHETRKCLKRIRALLRLVRPGLKPSDFQNENARYREVARLLSPARDAQILSETLLKLEPCAAPADASAIAALKQYIEALQPIATLQPDSATIASARQLLTEGRTVMAKLTVQGQNFAAVESGLADGYRRGLEHFESTYRNGSDETFHDWRKSVQLHWRHMALLSRAWPDLFTARVEAARQLSQILGDRQDISVLIQQIDALPNETLCKAGRTRLIRLARKRQMHLEAMAQPRGAQLFSLSPKALSRSVMEAWQAAREIDQLDHPKLAGPNARSLIHAVGATADEMPSEEAIVPEGIEAGKVNVTKKKPSKTAV